MSEDERTRFEKVADRLEQYRDASQEEKQYQLEKAIRDLCEDMPEEEIQNVLLLVDMLFKQWASETIHAALREDAIYPEKVVEAEQKVPKLLN
ncbi:MAG TPA: hypothetical protein VHV10_20345 [Ktedonobacteraceae bacterium]|jgi:transposase|nr:hypothetical protein [Ktedonobacteraceae bacterium]